MAYVQVEDSGRSRLLRFPFFVRRRPCLDDREVGYEGLSSVVSGLYELRYKRVSFKLHDQRLIDDLREHRDVPAPLSISYVRLGCALNGLSEYRLEKVNEPSDLTARARAEVNPHIAA